MIVYNNFTHFNKFILEKKQSLSIFMVLNAVKYLQII